MPSYLYGTMIPMAFMLGCTCDATYGPKASRSRWRGRDDEAQTKPETCNMARLLAPVCWALRLSHLAAVQESFHIQYSGRPQSPRPRYSTKAVSRGPPRAPRLASPIAPDARGTNSPKIAPATRSPTICDSCIFCFHSLPCGRFKTQANTFLIFCGMAVNSCLCVLSCLRCRRTTRDAAAIKGHSGSAPRAPELPRRWNGETGRLLAASAVLDVLPFCKRIGFWLFCKHLNFQRVRLHFAFPTSRHLRRIAVRRLSSAVKRNGFHTCWASAVPQCL